jgi:hypothetical protein
MALTLNVLKCILDSAAALLGPRGKSCIVIKAPA